MNRRHAFDPGPRPAAPAAGNALDRWLFAPQSPATLGTCRAVVCGLLLLHYLPADFRGWDAVAASFYEPVGVWSLLPGPATLPDAAVGVVQLLWKGALLLGCVGLFTRPAMWAAFAGAFYLLGVKACFGKVLHSEPTAVIALLVLALSRCGDAVSLDARLGRSARFSGRSDCRLKPAGRGESGDGTRSGGEYRWPLRVMWVVMTLVFATAGWQKIGGAGLKWASPESFVPMTLRHFHSDRPPTDLALLVARYEALAWAGGIGTLLVECLFPLVLFSRLARGVLVPAMFAMQLNIALVLGVYFWPFLPCYAFFVPWEAVGRWVGSRNPARGVRLGQPHG